MNNLIKKSDLSVCYDKTCVHANGENADMLAKVTALVMVSALAIVAAKLLR